MPRQPPAGGCARAVIVWGGLSVVNISLSWLDAKAREEDDEGARNHTAHRLKRKLNEWVWRVASWPSPCACVLGCSVQCDCMWVTEKEQRQDAQGQRRRWWTSDHTGHRLREKSISAQLVWCARMLWGNRGGGVGGGHNIYICIYLYRGLGVARYIYIHIYMYVYYIYTVVICINCVYVYTFTHICMYIYTCIYIYIWMYIYPSLYTYMY